MTSSAKRKARRRKLKAHDRGEDRHNPGLALIKKWSRLHAEHRQAVIIPVVPTELELAGDEPEGTWSEADLALLISRQLSIREVAEQTGRTYKQVSRKLNKLVRQRAVDPNPDSMLHWTEADERVLFLGLSLDEMAARTGRTRGGLIRKLLKMQLAGREVPLAPDAALAVAEYNAVCRDWKLTPTERAYLEAVNA